MLIRVIIYINHKKTNYLNCMHIIKKNLFLFFFNFAYSVKANSKIKKFINNFIFRSPFPLLNGSVQLLIKNLFCIQDTLQKSFLSPIKMSMNVIFKFCLRGKKGQTVSLDIQITKTINTNSNKLFQKNISFLLK